MVIFAAVCERNHMRESSYICKKKRVQLNLKEKLFSVRVVIIVCIRAMLVKTGEQLLLNNHTAGLLYGWLG